MIWLIGLAAAAPVQLNTATAEQLEALPLVGPQKAALWLDWRAIRGPCTSLDELRDLPGFGLATIEAIRPLAVCGEPSSEPAPPAPAPVLLRPVTIDVNGANEEMLRQLPGLAPDLAPAIIEYRDLHGPFDSCDMLIRVPGIGPATVAAMGSVCVAL
ncbi:MAG: helix-hairpin-helix domain-containing protein [Alphaproteobacteria bacterium]|nr:helix-hairpin-helix domain-containing protein [Alphaproteobacteria bacterium]